MPVDNGVTPISLSLTAEKPCKILYINTKSQDNLRC